MNIIDINKMTKKIVIKSCCDCSYKDHKGGFGKISYVPVCTKTGEELPYTVGLCLGVVTATYTGVIPESCPLENN